MRCLLLTLWIAVIFSHAAFAQTPPSGSGLPLPRFVSLKFDKVYARTGPDQSYPIAWVYQRQDLPVEITEEHDDWRKIRDIDGGEGWVHKIQLATRRMAVVQGAKTVAVTADPDPASPIVARLEPRVVTRLDKCNPDACKVEGDGYKGWLARKSLWGIYPGEDLH